jgi:hypothetical protein
MTERGIQKAMQDLKFCPEWETSGWLDVEQLDALYAEYRKGEDRNTEHYRYAMLRDGIGRRIPLADEHVTQCLTLAEKDMDHTMAGSVVYLLYHRMSRQQREAYRDSVYALAPQIKKEAEQDELNRVIREGVMTEEIFQECLVRCEHWLYRAMADALPLPYVERLDAHLEGKYPYVHRELLRRQFLLRWETEGFSEDLFAFALESQHGEIQRFLLDKEVLSVAQLQVLTMSGATRKVRKKASGQITHWANIEKRFTV